MNGGSVPDWLSSIGTMGALLIALWIVYRDHQRAEQDRATAKTHQESAQARRVVAWAVGLYFEEDRRYLHWVIKNDSDDPIYKVQLRLGLEEVDEETEPSYYVCDLIAPQTVVESRSVGEALPVRVMLHERTPPLELIFLDAAGRLWRRVGANLDAVLPERLPRRASLQVGRWARVIVTCLTDTTLTRSPHPRC